MSGLPDEAVEAMARAIDGCRPRDATWTAWTSVLARAAFAALPAGIYHSDGKGKVEFAPLVERGTSAEKTVVDSALFSVIERVAAERDAAVQRLAALSATDTDTEG